MGFSVLLDLTLIVRTKAVLLLCSTEQRKSNRFGTIWGWVNDNTIFRWTISLNKFLVCCYIAKGARISLHLASITCPFILSKAHNILFTIQQTFPWGFSLETLWKRCDVVNRLWALWQIWHITDNKIRKNNISSWFSTAGLEIHSTSRRPRACKVVPSFPSGRRFSAGFECALPQRG